jgi:non-heme chloroperoxidase
MIQKQRLAHDLIATATFGEMTSRYVHTATGLRMHYVEQGDLHGEPLLFVHGWPDSWFSYSLVLDALPSSYRALAVDLRGFGGTDRPVHGYTIDQHAADIAAFLEAVGISAATLVGHSMGSFIVRRVAELFPTHVKRLVLIGSAPTPLNVITRELQQFTRTLADPISPEFVREFQAGTIHHPVPEPFFASLVAASLQAPAATWRAALDGLLAFDDTADLRQIGAPTLILWGAHDGLFTAQDEQHQLAGAIPTARLRVYPDAGHSPNWEWPERIAQELTSFLPHYGLPAGQALRTETIH